MTLADARSLLRVSAKALRVRSASTDGQMKSGYPIWKRGLHARRAANVAPTSGRAFTGTSHPSRRWVIASAVVEVTLRSTRCCAASRRFKRWI